MKTERDSLFYPGLLGAVRSGFDKLKETKGKITDFSLSDCLMSGVALFGIKSPSLLQFDEDCHNSESPVKYNLQTLYGVKQVPSDTYMRERLDEVSPNDCQRGLNTVLRALQRGKELELFGGYLTANEYLLAIDGTGYFYSHQVHCDNCCVKHHRNGSIGYYHNALAAVMVNPSYKEVIPVAIEPITKQDGESKNDSERNSAKRLIAKIEAAHPHFKFRVLADGLYGNAPFIEAIHSVGWGYIITATPDDHEYLFDAFKNSKLSEYKQIEGKLSKCYSWANKLPLNASHDDLFVNMLEYNEYKDGKLTLHYCWITDLYLTKSNIMQTVKAGRSRWHVENQTFNTLKNQGYHFGHNFGHGYKNLTSVFAYLMFIAFAIDQVQQLTSKLFQLALKAKKHKCRLWELIRNAVTFFKVDSWEVLFQLIIAPSSVRLVPE